jgi:hypothetical protein
MPDAEGANMRRWIDQALVAACALVIALVGVVWASTSSRLTLLEKATLENTLTAVEIRTNHVEVLRRLAAIETLLKEKTK